MKKRLLASLLTLVMLLGLLPTAAFAETTVNVTISHQTAEYNPIAEEWSATTVNSSAFHKAKKQLDPKQDSTIVVAAGSKIAIPAMAEGEPGVLTDADGNTWYCCGYTLTSNQYGTFYDQIKTLTEESAITGSGTMYLKYWWAPAGKGPKDADDYKAVTCTYDFSVTENTLADPDDKYFGEIQNLSMELLWGSYAHNSPFDDFRDLEDLDEVPLSSSNSGVFEEECAAGYTYTLTPYEKGSYGYYYAVFKDNDSRLAYVYVASVLGVNGAVADITCDNEDYQFGGKVIMPDEDLTFTAKWHFDSVLDMDADQKCALHCYSSPDFESAEFFDAANALEEGLYQEIDPLDYPRKDSPYTVPAPNVEKDKDGDYIFSAEGEDGITRQWKCTGFKTSDSDTLKPLGTKINIPNKDSYFIYYQWELIGTSISYSLNRA